ncbi:MAG: hypothetical protein WCJ30_29520 [Deltaproteobacteria bacterium]
MSKQSSNDNRSRQLNPKDEVYWQSRGEPAAPRVEVPESDAPATSPAPSSSPSGGSKPPAQ